MNIPKFAKLYLTEQEFLSDMSDLKKGLRKKIVYGLYGDATMTYENKKFFLKRDVCQEKYIDGDGDIMYDVYITKIDEEETSAKRMGDILLQYC